MFIPSKELFRPGEESALKLKLRQMLNKTIVMKELNSSWTIKGNS